MIIPHYEILDKIAEGNQAAVYKACHKRNPGRLLVLKAFKAVSLTEGKKNQFRQKIEHLRVLNDSLVITPLSFEAYGGIYFIARDYFEGVALDNLAKAKGRIDLEAFFAIACHLARALEKVHEAGIIHGGVKPHNILVDPVTLDLRLIDFISALDVRDVSHFIYDPSFIRDALAYTSPEQTGRINHRVSFSSDLYSLGVVFYELLTGSLPFFSEDPLELIHFHLAEEAPEVRQVNPAVPAVLSDIVARLLIKEPEKRYRTGSGLLADLLRCRDEYAARGAIKEFPLESLVYTHRLAFISKMVGRDREAELILKQYEEVAGGTFRSLFISGLPGIGKTRLIQELQKPIVKHQGYFTSGKFDIYQKNIPYSSLTQALRNLVRTFLTESEERVTLWKERILKTLGNNGKVVIDVIPELETLIGPQPDVSPLPPVESITRFHDVFGRFLTCLATKENPLVLFIDDLQWCDSASFDFLADIFANYGDHPYLFFLGAYRHNEVDSSHPLTKLLKNAGKRGQPLREIRLWPLNPGHCCEMVSYILDSPPDQARTLSDFICALTEGNPLFISESLAYLYNENLLIQNKENGEWQWDLNKIRQSSMPETVVALFRAKIRKLPPNLVTLLEYCACLGNIFAPAELALISELTLPDIFETLKPGLGQGLLVETKDRLQFVHDRVQEAALSGIPPEGRGRIHRQIGSRLLAAVPEGADPEKLENLFTIVSHLNLGREEGADPDSLYFLADLNYHAGNKALSSLAIESANKYFKLSRELLPLDCWEAGHYDRTFRIYQKAAKTELMSGSYENSERLINELLNHARTDLDRVECLAEQATSLSSFGNFIKAIETANRGLAFFDKAIPESAEEVDKKRQKLVAEIAARNIDIRSTILNMPFATDRKSQVESAFYSELLADLYLSGRVPELYLTAAQATLHCLSAGLDENVMYAFTAMAIYLAEMGEFEQSFIYEDLTYDLAAKYPDTFAATKCMTGAVVTLMHSRSHPRDVANYSLKAIQCGKSCGDLNNAGYSYGPLMWNLQVLGADFPAIENYVKECLDFSRRYHLGIAAGMAEAVQAGWVEPMMTSYPAASSSGGYEGPGIEEKLAQWKRDNHIVSLGSYYVLKAMAHYYLGENKEAEGCLVSGEKHLSGFSNSILKREWHIFRVLNALSLHQKGTGFWNKSDLMKEIRPIIDQIEKWAALGPALRPYLAFLHAELARATGAFQEAKGLYLDAIDAAHALGYVFLGGYFNESFGEFLRQAGYCSEGVYFAEAVRLYRQCGAERKEIELLEKYPGYFGEEKTSSSPVAFESSPGAILPDLDVDYLIKSSLAISAEIEQDVLVKKIMNVIVECSAAQHGCLLMGEEDGLSVRAESHIAEKGEVRMTNRRLDEATDICRAVVRYVWRTGERLVLKDAAREGPFKDDPEVQELRLRSLLCLPIVKQSRMIGVLYLENRLFEGAFTPEKTQMAELLMSQAAISLDNARLLQEMKEAENQIKRSLEEKEALLREIHHRVKNNLQIVRSVLNLQLPYVKDREAVELFKESRDRVYSMALVHEQLYRSASLARIDLAEYIRSLTANLFLSYGVGERSIKPEISVESVAFDVDTLIPCALIINELVSNALKHAFPNVRAENGRRGEIRISLKSDGDGCVLTVADNGIGLPEGFAVEKAESLGIRLVNVLAKQLRGSIRIDREAGTTFTIAFATVNKQGVQSHA